jgi:hypothetical protein
MTILRKFIQYHFTLLSSTGCEMKAHERDVMQPACIDISSSKRMDDKVNYLNWMELKGESVPVRELNF